MSTPARPIVFAEPGLVGDGVVRSLSNAISLISPTTGPINFNSQVHTNFRAEPLGADPATVASGRFFFNTGLNALGVDDGLIIRTVPTLSATSLNVGQIPVVSSSNTTQFVTIPQGTAGQVLTVTSSTVVPSFQAATANALG